jgi:hypothetical protein
VQERTAAELFDLTLNLLVALVASESFDRRQTPIRRQRGSQPHRPRAFGQSGEIHGHAHERGRQTEAASGMGSIGRAYFNELDTLVKVLFNCVPTPATTAMMATAMPAAIKPYSIAVAPVWSFWNRRSNRDTVAS